MLSWRDSRLMIACTQPHGEAALRLAARCGRQCSDRTKKRLARPMECLINRVSGARVETDYSRAQKLSEWAQEAAVRDSAKENPGPRPNSAHASTTRPLHVHRYYHCSLITSQVELAGKQSRRSSDEGAHMTDTRRRHAQRQRALRGARGPIAAFGQDRGWKP